MSIRSLTMLAVVAGLTLSIPAFGQNEKPKSPTPTPAPTTAPAPAKQPAAAKPADGGKTEAQEAQDFEKASAPGVEHIDLAKTMVGSWNTETSAFMPGQAPMVAKGTAKFDPVMGIRFIRQTTQTDIGGGKKINGEGLIGYNTVSKEYEATWIDSTATGIMTMTGKKDAKGDIVFTGQTDSMASGQKTTSKFVLHRESKDKMSFTSYEAGSDGKEVKMTEVVYTRSTPMGKPAEKKEETK
jgi:hypothetical protein